MCLERGFTGIRPRLQRQSREGPIFGGNSIDGRQHITRPQLIARRVVDAHDDAADFTTVAVQCFRFELDTQWSGSELDGLDTF